MYSTFQIRRSTSNPFLTCQKCDHAKCEEEEEYIYLYMYILVIIMFKKFISTSISQFLQISISHERLQICPRILNNNMLRTILYHRWWNWNQFNFLIKKVIEMSIVAWVQLSLSFLWIYEGKDRGRETRRKGVGERREKVGERWKWVGENEEAKKTRFFFFKKLSKMTER